MASGSSSAAQLRLYKDESLTPEQLDKLNELYQIFKVDNPKWLSRHECLNLKSSENIIVAFNVFEGPAFEHLRKLSARIVSVQCMITSFKCKKKLPRSIKPIFSLSMSNLNVCCSNVEKKLREEIYSKVEMMHGKTAGIFTDQITHLVTNEVGSSKYHAAGSVKMPIMLPEWVLNVWMTSENRDVHASDSEFLKHKCPIFHNLVICASGYSDTTKKELKSLIESAGGKYKGDLVCGTTTHLVINKPEGSKYDHAKMWKINIVSSLWIQNSIKEGYCQPEKNYFLAENQTSTPTNNDSKIVHKTKQGSMGDIDLSVIGTNGNLRRETSAKCINETENNADRTSSMNNTTIMTGNFSNAFQTSSNMRNSGSLQSPLPPSALSITNKTSFSDILKELNAIGKIKLDLFDGTGIYCEHFDSLINEKLKKICNSGGATRFDEYNSDVTHVIVASTHQVNDVKCKFYIDQNPEVNILKIEWLIKSCKDNQLADCKTHCVFKNALNSVKTPKKRARPESKTGSAVMSNSIGSSADLSDCLSQYMNQGSEITMQMRPVPPVFEASSKVKIRDLNLEDNDRSSSSTSTKSTPITAYEHKNKNQGVFSNKRIRICGFEENEVKELENVLYENGADMVADPSEYTDFNIFPATIPDPITENNVVTVYWIQQTTEQNKLCDPQDDFFYQPIPRYNDDKPLSDCVITVSGYTGCEKENITKFCKLLGAHTQQSFSLKDQPNNIRANTHLISKQMSGPKYIAAKTWKKPTVSPEWLIESCITGVKADEEKYFIENKFSYKDLYEFTAKVRRSEANSTASTYGCATAGANSASSYSSKKDTTAEVTNDTSLAEYLNSSKNIYDSDKVKEKVSTPAKTTSQNEETQIETDAVTSDDLSLSFHNESKKPRLDSLTNKKNMDLDDNDDDQTLATLENPAIKKTSPATTTIRQESENSSFHTPTFVPPQSKTLCNPRLKELKKFNTFQSPSNNYNTPQEKTPQRMSIESSGGGHNTSLNTSNVKTPLWMKPNKNGEIAACALNLDWDNAMDFLKTPDALSNSSRRSNMPNQKSETPLDELFTKSINIAKENTKKPEFYKEFYQSPDIVYSFESNPKIKEKYRLLKERTKLTRPTKPNTTDDESPMRMNPTQPLKQQILKDVYIYVCKQFQKEQLEYYDLVVHLGGQFLWNYNSSCTHFVYMGKLSDENDNELNLAKRENKCIVSPSWLYDCQRQNKHVCESLHLIANEECEQDEENEQEKDDSVMTNDETTENNSKFFDKNENQENGEEAGEEAEEEAGEEEEEEEEKQQQHIQEDKPEETKQMEIPDSMAMKHEFLEQLSDKLANIKSNSITNKKWSKNNSGNLVTTSTTPIVTKTINNNETNQTNRDFMSETDLFNSADMSNLKKIENNLNHNKKDADDDLNELNKSKSKWGVSCSNSDKNSENNSNHNKEDSDELNNINGKKNSKRKIGNNLLNRNGHKSDNGIEEDKNNADDASKKSVDSLPPPASQIQVTLWNDGSNANASAKTNTLRGQKPISNRILNAAKAASSVKNGPNF